MRHTRMRQIAKAHREEEHSREWRDEVGTDPINFIRHCKSLGLSPQLDPTFKWHRECYPWGHNYVEFEKEVPVPPGRIEKRAILRRVK